MPVAWGSWKRSCQLLKPWVRVQHTVLLHLQSRLLIERTWDTDLWSSWQLDRRETHLPSCSSSTGRHCFWYSSRGRPDLIWSVYGYVAPQTAEEESQQIWTEQQLWHRSSCTVLQKQQWQPHLEHSHIDSWRVVCIFTVAVCENTNVNIMNHLV